MYTGGDPSDYQPLVDWGIFTEPIPAANGRRFLYVQGKALGVCPPCLPVSLVTHINMAYII